MRKITSLLLIFCLCAGVLGGCVSKKAVPNSAESEETSGQSFESETEAETEISQDDDMTFHIQADDVVTTIKDMAMDKGIELEDLGYIDLGEDTGYAYPITAADGVIAYDILTKENKSVYIFSINCKDAALCKEAFLIGITALDYNISKGDIEKLFEELKVETPSDIEDYIVTVKGGVSYRMSNFGDGYGLSIERDYSTRDDFAAN